MGVLACGCVDLAQPAVANRAGDGGPSHDVAKEMPRPDALVPDGPRPDEPVPVTDGPEGMPDASADAEPDPGDTGVDTQAPIDTQVMPDAAGGAGGAGGADAAGGAGGSPADVGGPDTTPPPPDLAPANLPPTVASAAAAAPSPVTGTTTLLTVVGADDQGEAGLVYTWSAAGPAGALVAFSDNGSNSAKATTVIFTATGSYMFTVVIRDAGGLATMSSVVVQVNQTANDVVITPAMVSLAAGATQAFTANTFDQFGAPLAAQGAVTWSLAGSCGTLSSTGLFTAAFGPGATCTVTATSGAVSDSATVAVGSAAPTVLSPIADVHVEESNDDKNFGGASTLLVKTQSGSPNDRRAYFKFSLAGVPALASQAILRIYGRSDSSTTMEAITGMTDTSWSETAVTWKNKPALGSTLATESVTTTRKYREWDVTAFVRARQMAASAQIAFGLFMATSTPNPPDSFSSRESGSNPPQLVLTP